MEERGNIVEALSIPVDYTERYDWGETKEHNGYLFREQKLDDLFLRVLNEESTLRFKESSQKARALSERVELPIPKKLEKKDLSSKNRMHAAYLIDHQKEKDCKAGRKGRVYVFFNEKTGRYDITQSRIKKLVWKIQALIAEKFFQDSGKKLHWNRSMEADEATLEKYVTEYQEFHLNFLQETITKKTSAQKSVEEALGLAGKKISEKYKKERDRLRGEKIRLQKSLSQAKKTNSTLTDNLGKLEEKFGQLAEEATDLKKKLQDIEESTQPLEEQLKALTEEKQALESQLEESVKQNTALETEKGEIQKQLETLAQQEQELKVKLEESKEQNAALKTEKGEIQKQLETLAQQEQELKVKLEESKEQNVALKTEKEEAREQVKALAGEKQTLEEQVEKALNDLAANGVQNPQEEKGD